MGSVLADKTNRLMPKKLATPLEVLPDIE